MYDLYVDMKKTELVVGISTQQTIGELNDGEQGAANFLQACVKLSDIVAHTQAIVSDARSPSH
jgi:hypothetical protein